jgi:hypothetical protein
MSYWIFQGVPSRYDVAEKLVAGRREIWLATRYRDEMQVGDVVFFWRAGDRAQRGIYGWGEIVGPPEHHEGWGWGVPVQYRKRFEHHLPVGLLQGNEKISTNLIFRMPVGTNFRVEPREVSGILEEIAAQLGSEALPEE